MVVSRREAVKLALGATAAFAFGGVVTGCSASSGSASSAAAMNLGLSPYGDEMLIAAAIKRGYFDKVGISFSNGQYGIKTDLIKSVTPLLNNQIDLGSGYPPAVASQLDNVSGVVGFAYSDVFYGYRILAPKGKYKTVAGEMASGATFDQALTTVMAQLVGKDVILRTGVASTFYDLLGRHSGTSMNDWNLTYLANDEIVRQAESGKVDFVSPTGAVEIVRLQGEGWEPLVQLRETIDNLPSEETIALRATFSGYLTTKDWAQKNWDSILRFSSVMYRIIDDMKADPQGTAADFVDKVNEYTGSSLTAADLAGTFDGLYELHTYAQADAMYNDPSYAFNFDTVMNANLKVLKEQGVLKGDYTSSDLSIAKDVYNSLKDYQAKCDEIFKKADKSSSAYKTAKEFYDVYDFVDAFAAVKSLA